MFGKKNRLKNLKVTSVDLCKQGANQDANIALMKSLEGGDIVSEYFNMAKSFSSVFGNDNIDETLEFYAKSMEESEQSIMEDESMSESEKSEMLAKSKDQFYQAVAELFKSAKVEEEDEEEGEPEEKEPEEKEPEKESEEKAEEEVEPKMEMNPEVKKAMDEVAELRKALEMRDMMDVAKQYEIIGKNANELAEKLYGLKKAGGTAYDDYVGLLDEMKKTAESGVFKEYGSSKSGTTNNLSHAVAEILKQHPNLTTAQAVVKAYEQNPELDEMA